MNTTPSASSRTPDCDRARQAATGRLAKAAHWHAARGLAVFPLAAGAKVPAIEDWQHAATTDPDQITKWWHEAPYNIGVATGTSGLLVIDLDRPKPGETPPEPWNTRGATCGRDVLDQLANQAGHRLPRTWTVTTASGGQHLYFRQPDAPRLGNTADRLGWKIDTRGHGGYVVAAGSVIGGQRYRADVIRRPAVLPNWIAT
ncbi:MAG: bifunctional DNA primase/polymerase, partial [Micromonosporaceae bacterium]